MADKSIDQLNAAEKIYATDLFVLQQSGSAKKLTGQVLLNWLTAAADGHGGIKSIEKLSTSGLVDTYRITLADTTVFDFVVNNGRGITSITQTSVSGLTRTYTIAFNDDSSQTFTVTDGRAITDISKTSTSGLVDTYRISFNDGTHTDFPVQNGRGIKTLEKTKTSGLVDTYTVTYTDGTTSNFTVTNGEKGDKGDNAYIWIKYASQEPMESSHSMGDIPDNWIGIYSGNASSAPSDWKQYKWFKYKGEKGDTGSPATLVTKSVTYQVSDSGTIIPSGVWGSSIPVVSQGKYLWTKTELQFNSGDPIVSYSVARMGVDGSGSVSSVNNVSPDETGNVTLAAADVGALPSAGGDMTGAINMNGQSISGLNDPTEESQAARKGYVDAAKTAANAYTDAAVRKAAPRNLLDNSDFRNPVNQRGQSSYTNGGWGYCIDRWLSYSTTATITENGLQISGSSRNIIGQRFALDNLKKNPEDYTFVYCDSNDVIHFSSHKYKYNEFWEFWIECSETTVIKWAALYEGSYTAETLPEYQPKGYAAELAECMRYFQRIKGGGTGWDILTAAGIADSSVDFYALPITRMQMRISPSVSYNGSFRTIPQYLTVTDITAGSISSAELPVLSIHAEVTHGNVYVLQQNGDTSAYVDLSADL